MKSSALSRSPGLCPKVIATLANGFPVYAIYGAEGEGEGEGGNKPDDKKTGEGSNDDGKTGDDGNDEPDEDSELERMRRKHREAEKHRKIAEAKAEKLEKEKLDKLDRAEREAKENGEKATSLEGKVKEQSLQIEFFASDKYTWHNRKAALKLLDLDGVEIDDDGDVTGLDKAIDKLAKDHPYLVKPKEDNKSGEGDDKDKNGKGKDDSKGKNGSSGSNPKNTGGSNNSGTDEKRRKLELKYPSLVRNRVNIPS